MKSILKLLATELLKTVIEIFIKKVKEKLNENHSIDQLTKEKFVVALDSVNVDEVIKTV